MYVRFDRLITTFVFIKRIEFCEFGHSLNYRSYRMALLRLLMRSLKCCFPDIFGILSAGAIFEGSLEFNF